MNDKNPLLEKQREKSGAETFGKYLYQYHWALYRVLQEHEEKKDYAVFIELHEDVVLANSLNRDEVKFEFSQVKTNKNNFTKNSLLKTKNGSSVLGKLIESTSSQNFNKSITKINLVSTGGFNKDFTSGEIVLDDISVNDIPSDKMEELCTAILTELSLDYFPINLHFITPELPGKGFQKFIIGYISEVVAKLYPDSMTQAENIYRPLIDELTRKGMITNDFKEWEELLKNKALTSITVTEVITQFIKRKNDDEIFRELESILNELGLNTIQKSTWKKSFRRYYLNRLGNKTLGQLDIKVAIESSMGDCNDEIHNLIGLVQDKLPIAIQEQFTQDIDVKTAIICEYILKDIE